MENSFSPQSLAVMGQPVASSRVSPSNSQLREVTAACGSVSSIWFMWPFTGNGNAQQQFPLLGSSPVPFLLCVFNSVT